MVIGALDVVTTTKITKTLKRKSIRENSKSKRLKKTETCTEKLSSTSESESVQSDAEEPTQIKLRTSSGQSKSDTRLDYTLLSKTCDRFGVSDRAGAAIASVVLHASGSQVIDKNKLRRERKKARENIVSQQTVSQIHA
ncbi:unnamed protein product [Acanthoscelides obtectus]|nr:unnamed protein product [Acanthoscelides obtectus]CAK1620289.1 hypothetical protein AOBTE_LOCUS283 [Acanthoscelides obtectus]